MAFRLSRLFLDIPESQQIAILASWLCWRDIRCLDSAVCSSEHRTAFLSLISSSGCIFDKIDYSWHHKEPPFKWAIARNVQARCVGIGFMQLECAIKRKQILQHFKPRLDSISISLVRYGTRYPLKPATPNFDLALVLTEVGELCPRASKLHVVGMSVHFCLIPHDNYVALPTQLQTIHLDGLQVTTRLTQALCALACLVDLSVMNCLFDTSPTVDATCTSVSLRILRSCNTPFCAHFPNITELHLSVPTVADLQDVASHCRQAKKVNITFTAKSWDRIEVDVDGARQMAACWRHIEFLSVEMTEKAAVVMVEECSTLTTLNACGGAVFFSAYEALPDQFAGSRLHTLSLVCDFASTLRAIIAHCPLLHTLHAHQSERLQYTDETDFLERNLQIIAATGIKELYLYGYEMGLQNSELCVLQGTRLTALGIKTARFITNEAILELVQTLNCLHTLKLQNCAAVRAMVVLQLPSACPTLRTLYLVNTVDDPRAYVSDYERECAGSQQLVAQMMKIIHPIISECVVRC